MESSEVPPLAWVAFGGAFVAGLTLFGSLFVIARRLGASWRKHTGGFHLDPTDASRIGRMLWGREVPPVDAQVGPLLWIVRVSWFVMAAAIISFVVLLAGVA